MKEIIIVTDTIDEVNGVSTTIKNVIKYINPEEYLVNLISPRIFENNRKFYGASFSRPDKDFILDFLPPSIYSIHVLTEGPIGLSVRNTCVKYNLKFTTSLLTMWDTFCWKNFYIPPFIISSYLKWFHSKSSKLMVSSTGMFNIAKKYNKKYCIWGKGTDNCFYPRNVKKENNALYVGRISKEKNIEDFLKLDIPYTKVVVGNGPLLNTLKDKYKDVVFKGELFGDKLAEEYSKASVFVFPSKFDSFGLVMIEAIACGTPVAAYPINGPSYVLTSKKVGVTSYNLKDAVKEAVLKFDPEYAKMFSLRYNWQNSANQFINNLEWNNYDSMYSV